VKIRFIIRTIGVLAGLAVAGLAHAVQVQGLRMWSSADSTRVVFDINAPVEHNVFVLHNPDRVVIDLHNTHVTRNWGKLDFSHSLVKDIRSARRNGKDLRVVLDMKIEVKPKSFMLKPTQGYGHRLVLDLDRGNVPVPAPMHKSTSTKKSQPVRPVVIAIDAGHGGEDPGATGKRGTREKDVVLQISHRLERLIRHEWGMTPVMIRDGDYYVSLRGRMKKARQHKADLFVSIHADAARSGQAHGASVFVLSQRGASSEAARWLAASQNNADLIGGVSLDDKDDLLASVLLDLSQNATIAASSDVAQKVLSEFRHVGSLHKGKVEHAGFVVLKSPDVPSILVETGFISNRREEARLRNRHYQGRIARAVFNGVRRYFQQNPPPGTLLARAGHQRYRIRHGDTLSDIAQRFQVSQLSLKSLNKLSSDVLQVGQVLRIPELR
jgi:N-acetylmuramoyl-L-alanine amidase